VSFRADLEDCPRHEIAADIGLIENTTAQLLFRARRSLKSALDARA
jgi:DNA-directed RNA polymerase specialized sigma24 family protein